MKKSMASVIAAIALFGSQAIAQDVADMSNLEYAHIAYTADNIDIRYWRTLVQTQHDLCCICAVFHVALRH